MMKKRASTSPARQPAETSVRTFTCAEVAEHSTRDDLWIIVDNTVYDMTAFLARHPGGSAPLRYAGQDASLVFGRVHKAGVLDRFGAKLTVGVLAPGEASSQKVHRAASSVTVSGAAYDVAADPDGYDERVGGEDGREFGDHMAAEGETSHIPTVIAVMYLALGAWASFARWACGCSIWAMPSYYLAGMLAFYLWHLLAHSEGYHTACKRAGLPYLAEMHEIHMEHHLERFPPGDFYGSAALFAEMYPGGKPTIWSLMDLTQTTSIADGTALSKELDRGGAADGAVAGGGGGETSPPKHSPLAHEWPLLALLILILGGAKLAGASWATTACAFVLHFCMASVGNALHMSFHVRNFHLERYSWYRELRTLHYIHHLGDMKSNFAMLNMGMDQLFHSLTLQDFDLAPSRRSTPRGYFRAFLEGKRDADLPHGMAVADVLRSAAHGGLVAAALGFDVPLDVAETCGKKRAHLARGGRYIYPAVLLRIALTVWAFALWFSTEASALQGGRPKQPGGWLEHISSSGGGGGSSSSAAFDDPGHVMLAGLRAWLREGDGARAAAACAASALTSEVLTAAIVGVSVLGPSFRPLLAVILAFLLRLALHLLGATKAVALAPGSAADVCAAGALRASLFTFHGPHLFLSARIALCAVASLELLAIAVHGYTIQNASMRLRAAAAALAAALLTFEVGVSLALELSCTFDIVLTLVVARYCTIAAARLAPLVDAFMP